MNKIRNEFWAVLLGKTAIEIQEILKPATEGAELTAEEAEARLQPLFTAKFQRAKDDGFSVENAKSKAKKEAMLKSIATKLGVDFSENLDEMMDAGIAKFSQKDPTALTDADIIKHPLYAKLKADKEAEIVATKADFDGFKNEIASKEKAQKVRKAVMPMLDKFGLAIPDGEVGENMLNAMFQTLIGADIKVDFDTLNNPILLDKDGNLVKDPINLNPITFESHLQKHAAGYLLPKPAGAQGGGTNNHGQTPPAGAQGGAVQVGSYLFVAPKDNREYLAKMREIKTDDELRTYQDFAKKHFESNPQ